MTNLTSVYEGSPHYQSTPGYDFHNVLWLTWVPKQGRQKQSYFEVIEETDLFQSCIHI